MKLYHGVKIEHSTAIAFYVSSQNSDKITGKNTDIFTHFTDYILKSQNEHGASITSPAGMS